MKLIRCHIENFGKLSDLTMDFSEGINVINQSNAWGKSTLAAFLKAMFYGLDSKKDPKAFDKERNIYRPWQGGAFGGEVDFQVGDHVYRISRSFGRTEKNDEFHLYDLSTNLESDDYSEEIGVELFELDSASFKRSIYIAQSDCASATSDGINAKLGNLAENTDDINNFEAANNRLKTLLLQLTPDRVTGSIKKRKSVLTQLEQDIRSYQSAQDGIEAVKRLEARTQERIAEMQAIRKDYAAALVIASEDSRKKELYAQYDALCADVAEKEEKVNSYKEFFPNRVPTPAEFEIHAKNIRLMEEAKSAIRSQVFTEEEQNTWNVLRDMFAREKPTDREIDAAIAMIAEVDKQKEEIARQESVLAMYAKQLEENVDSPRFGVGYRVFDIGGVVLLVAGIAVFLGTFLNFIPNLSQNLLMIVSLGVIVLGAICSIVGVVWGTRVKRARRLWEQEEQNRYQGLNEMHGKLASTVNRMREGIREVNGTIREFLGKYHVYCEVKDYPSHLYELKNQLREYERLLVRQDSLLREQGNSDRLYKEVMMFAREYLLNLGEDPASGLNVLQNKATEYKLAVYAYEESVAKKEAFEKRQTPGFWTREMRCPYSIEELNRMIEDADKNIEELKQNRSGYSKQLDNLQEQLDLRDEKVAELEEQRQQQAKDIHDYHILSLTNEFLTKAKEQLTARYMEPIAKGFSKYYQLLTKDDRGEWMIDANINLKVREYGELRETKWLSAGYQDLIGVCMRLALVDAMYDEEKPFLILDDPFVNLDQEKVDSGNQLLLSVAQEYQVIYFTCHDSRSPL